MEWRDEGFVISARPHGETSAIVEVFCRSRGRHSGVVRGAMSRRLAPVLQAGHQVDVRWRARLDHHIGSLSVEPIRSRSGILADRRALAALNAVMALLHFALPDRQAHATLYAETCALLDRAALGGDWQADYLRWELRLLEELGYGLDLGRCALTGSRDDLAYVSPTSGRAVARGAAGDWAPRLLPLPPCLLGQGPATPDDLEAGLLLTGHFLTRFFADLDRDLPEARRHLAERLAGRHETVTPSRK